MRLYTMLIALYIRIISAENYKDTDQQQKVKETFADTGRKQPAIKTQPIMKVNYTLKLIFRLSVLAQYNPWSDNPLLV